MRRAHSARPIKRKWYWYEKLREQIQGKKRERKVALVAKSNKHGTQLDHKWD